MSDRISKAAGQLAKMIHEYVSEAEHPRGIKARIAREIGVSFPVLLDYLAGRKRPKNERRRAIQKWSRGRVRASEWEFPEERAQIDGVQLCEPLKKKARGRKAAA